MRRNIQEDITIFISYAHEDERLCTKLRKYLRSLERVKDIKVWSDRILNAGAEWEREISFYLNTAQIILLLISPDFIDSDYCYTIEMKRAMERHEAGKASVIPIILRPVIWNDTPFATLQVLPTDAKPVTSRAWHTQDYAFFDIVQGLRKVIEGEKINRPVSISIGYDHRQDFSEEVPDITNFYGRERELADLKHWILDDHCQSIAVVGTGGLGKTSLVLRLAEQIKDQFEYVFWRSLLHHSLQSVLQDCIHFVSNQQKTELSENIEGQLDDLIPYLRNHRCLLILDNFESVMQDGDYVAGSTEYGRLLERVGRARELQSCLLLTSREKPREMIPFTGQSMPMRSLMLSGLSAEEGRKILNDKGLSDNEDSSIDDLVRLYSGNPLLLQLVADPIHNLYGDNIASFLQEESIVIGEIKNLLDEQFRRLTLREEEIMYWLAIEREAVSLNDLRENMLTSVSKKNLPDALLSLQRRSLIETRGVTTFTLQPVVMEYITERFVQRVCQEFEAETVGLLDNYALMKAQSQDYVRESQIRFIVMPIAKQLHDTLGQEEFEEKCQRLLSQLRATPSLHLTYAAGNILNTLIQLGYDLHQCDFSHLNLRQAYLQGVSLCDVNFDDAHFVQPLFTDTFGDILTAAYNPDGSLLAAGTDNGEIRIWDIANGALIRTFRSNSDWIRSVVFSPDGTMVASGGEDYTVRLWEVSTGICRKVLQGHTNLVRTVAFSANGQFLASGGYDGCIKLWDVATGKDLNTLYHPEQQIFYSVAFSPDGKLLAGGSEDNVLRLWDIRTGQVFKHLDGHAGPIGAVAFSPNGKTIASGSNDHTIRLWDANTGELLKVLKGHKYWIWSVVFSSDGTMIASGGEDCTVRIWDVNSGQCLKTLLGHTNTVCSVPFHPKGHILASASTDLTIRIWDVAGGWCLKVLQGYTNGILSVAFSPDGKTIASGSQDRKVRLWDMKTGQCTRALIGSEDRVWSVAFSPNGRQLISGSVRPLHVWDIYNGQHWELAGNTNWVYNVAFSPDGKMIASAGDDGMVRLWDVDNGNCRTIPAGGGCYSVAFSSDGKRLAAEAGPGTVYVWDLRSNEPLLIIKYVGQIYPVAFSPDGDIIVGGEEGGMNAIYLWDAHTGQPLKTLVGHTGTIWDVVFSPDGKTIASGSADSTVRLWDANTGLCKKVLQEHTDLVSSVAFSPDGKTIASGSQDGTIKCWNTKTGRCLGTFRSDRPYERMNITGVRGITEVQKAMLKTLGAFENEGEILL